MNTQLKLNDPARAKQFFSDKVAFTTGSVELDRDLENGANVMIIDVRAADDYEKGHLPGAISLPREKWKTPTGLRKDTLNIVYCYSQVCHLAAAAAVEFAGQGYPVMELVGGFAAWKEHDLKIVE